MIRLVTYHYSAPRRQHELDYCLLANVANPHVGEIRVIAQHGLRLAPPIANDVTGRVTVRDEEHVLELSRERRPILASLIRYCNSFVPTSGDVTILSNADVFLDGTVTRLYELANDELAALAVHEWSPFGRTHEIRAWNNWQSAWAWRGRLDVDSDPEWNLPWGCPGMDNRIAFLVATGRGRRLINPARTVRVTHVHPDHQGHTRDKVRCAPGPWAIIAPHEMGERPWIAVKQHGSEIELSRWMEVQGRDPVRQHAD